METIDPTMTLGALVTLQPGLAREMERRGLDYCCGGRQSLTDACRQAGLDPEITTRELMAAVAGEPPSDWSTMNAVQLVDHLEATHHRYLWNEMPRLSALVAKVASVHGDRHGELGYVAACYADVRADLTPHLLKEERILFPMIRELAVADAPPMFHCGTLRNPISVMLGEHEAVGDLLSKLRTLTNGYEPPADACASYVACYAAFAELEADTHLHIHKENNVLFPLVLRMESMHSA
jgi:regulator of cell morphogenesis and NO signaling